MGTRGRKSGDDLALSGPVSVSARPDACYSLRDEEAEVWASIVESLPADWITPGNAPVLAVLCRATVSARRIGQLIYQAETKGAYGVERHLAQIRAHSQVAGTIKQLATSLRLTPQARYTPQKAGTHGRSRGPKPWE